MILENEKRTKIAIDRVIIVRVLENVTPLFFICSLVPLENGKKNGELLNQASSQTTENGKHKPKIRSKTKKRTNLLSYYTHDARALSSYYIVFFPPYYWMNPLTTSSSSSKSSSFFLSKSNSP